MRKDFASQYATALFEIALDNNNVDLIFHQLNIISNSIASDEQFLKLLVHPKVTKDEKKQIIANIYQEFTKTLVNFLYVLLDNDRIEDIKDINEQFIVLFNEYNNVIIVEAQSTIQLDNLQIEKLTKKLIKKYKHKIEVKNVINPSILGGMRLLINGEIIDSSLKTQFINLKSHILKQN